MVEKNADRLKKIANQETFTYRTNDAFDEYESTLPPSNPVQNPLETTETQPDWSKAKSSKTIKMKINFKPLPEVKSDDSEEDLPPVLDEPEKSKNLKKRRIFDDPEPVEESNRLEKTSEEYTDLPKNAVAIPILSEKDFKPAGSGITNSSLRKYSK